jgi:hypothetical protein
MRVNISLPWFRWLEADLGKLREAEYKKLGPTVMRQAVHFYLSSPLKKIVEVSLINRLGYQSEFSGDSESTGYLYLCLSTSFLSIYVYTYTLYVHVHLHI